MARMVGMVGLVDLIRFLNLLNCEETFMFSRGTRLWATHDGLDGGLDENELQCWLISRWKANGRANG